MKSSINEMKNSLESTENREGPIEEIIHRLKDGNLEMTHVEEETLKRFYFVSNEETMRTIYIRKGNIKIMGIPEERKREQRTFKEIITEFFQTWGRKWMYNS